MNCDVLVIGSGPAGLMAAGKAAFDGARVILVEKESDIAPKMVCATEKDALLTNLSQRIQFQHNIYSGEEFVEKALKLLSPRKFLLLLEGIGISYDVEKELLVSAKEEMSAVREKLKSWLDRCGVKILTNSKVTSLHHAEGVIKEAQVLSEEREICITASTIIVTTGGVAQSPKESCGDGYNFAQSIGHTLVTPFPSLVPLTLGERKKYKPLQGLQLSQSRLYLWADNRKIADKEGEVIFTQTGISGEATINLSRFISVAHTTNTPVILTLDTIPHIDEGDLEKELITLFAENPKEPIMNLLTRYVPQRLATFLMSEVCRFKTVTGAHVSGKMRKEIRATLKRLSLPLLGTETIDMAHMTAGGVSRDEINPETMESYICSGLYFAGEVVDIDANREGFNMHLAFATGRLAGESAAAAL